jgi:hypothetical protein
MKRIAKIISIFSVTGFLILLSSCMTTPKVNYDESMGTPENSVLVYGMANGINHITFTEVTKSGKPDVLDYTVNGNLVFCPKPLKMGTHYKVTYLEGVGSFSYSDMTIGNITTHSTDRTQDTYDENTKQVKDFEFTVPDKPGLYFYGIRLIKNPGEGASKGRIMIGNPSEADMKKMCLKKALTVYAGTVWEPVLQKELESFKK